MLRGRAAALLNGRHAGATVFVVGAGPQLAALTAVEIAALEASVTIGVNRTSYRLRPTYFLSAYIAQVLMAQRHSDRTTFLHMRPILEPPLAPGIVPLRREDFAGELPRRLRRWNPCLHTKRNVALGATHLAHILGAGRIAYVGVEQRNARHFFDGDAELARRMAEDVASLAGLDFLDADHHHTNFAWYQKKLVEPIEEELAGPFFSIDHAPTFRAYFEILEARGVEVFSTVVDSVVCDAGAAYRPLEELLAGPGDRTPGC